MSTEEMVKPDAPAKKKTAAKATKTAATKTAAKTAGAEPVAKVTKAKAAKPVEVETKAIAAPTHDEIARLAVQYWIDRGFEHGQNEQDWFRAEQELRAKAS